MTDHVTRLETPCEITAETREASRRSNLLVAVVGDLREVEGPASSSQA